MRNSIAKSWGFSNSRDALKAAPKNRITANEKTRNLGIRIITRSYEKTYNEKENTEILNMIVEKLTSKFNITLNEKGE